MAEEPAPKKDNYYEFKPFVTPRYRVEFSQTKQLSSVLGYVWFTPAMLFLWGRFSEVNLSDIVQRHDIKLFWYRFDKAIFQGFDFGGDVSWNHTLWAVETAKWSKFVDAVLETVQFDLEKAMLYQYGLQEVSVPDPLAMDLQRVWSAQIPSIPVYGFAVLSNTRQSAFERRLPTAVDLPRVVSFPPSDVHVTAAAKLFSIKGLTRDAAFARYRTILLAAQDASYAVIAAREGKTLEQAQQEARKRGR